MSQFIGVIPIPDENSTTVETHFIQYVLMK